MRSLWTFRIFTFGTILVVCFIATTGTFFQRNLATFAILGVAFFFYFSLRRKVKLVAVFISRFQKGDLRARIPVKGTGELSRLVEQINAMANEIETLVEHLKGAELARTRLMRELSHDLRTPLASLRALSEGLLEMHEGMLPNNTRRQLEYSLQEIDYIQRLIEDLFLLAQLDDPIFRSNTELISVNELVKSEVDRFRQFEVGGTAKKEIFVETMEFLTIRGHSFLLKRMLRNALDNARRYSTSVVRVSVTTRTDGQIEIKIRDDGHGFTHESQKTFGERRTVRFLEARAKTKFSLGLGSVIINAIVKAHRGHLLASNWSKTDGTIGGAEIRLRIPRFS